MRTVHDPEALRRLVAGWRAAGQRVALVPTMGNLHDGHLALVAAARQRVPRTVVSIFVNPFQFGPGEDFDSYPRTLAQDARRLEAAGADVLFAPSVEAMYPDGLEATTEVRVPALDGQLCGAFRPGHFTGVATVVTKLFNLVMPDLAVFGDKDYQQLLVIRRIVRELCMPVEVLGVETVREADGLAMSSRNSYLTAEERRRAPALYQVLQRLAGRLAGGEGPAEALERKAWAELEAAGFRPEYVSVRDAATLGPPRADAPRVVLAAAWLGRSRLIDHVAVPQRV